MTVRTLPMFPLGSVLLPHMVLPLHIFEPRYRALVRDVLDDDACFGVVMIDRGREVGGGEQRSDLGTVAKILEAREMDDGRWAVVSAGFQRLRVRRWLDDAPYPLAEVELLDEDEPTAEHHELREQVAVRLRRLLARATELGDTVADATTELAEDPVAASFQATVLTPLGPLDRQRLLDEDDTAVRLRSLLGALDELEEDLRLRFELLAAGEDPA